MDLKSILHPPSSWDPPNQLAMQHRSDISGLVALRYGKRSLMCCRERIAVPSTLKLPRIRDWFLSLFPLQVLCIIYIYNYVYIYIPLKRYYYKILYINYSHSAYTSVRCSLLYHIVSDIWIYLSTDPHQISAVNIHTNFPTIFPFNGVVIVDGRNPAPIDRWFIMVYPTIYKVSTICPRCRISSIHSMFDDIRLSPWYPLTSHCRRPMFPSFSHHCPMIQGCVQWSSAIKKWSTTYHFLIIFP
jgi:hypothetical protein